jgi:polyhydroxyalkanoate synthesis regulator protein
MIPRKWSSAGVRGQFSSKTFPIEALHTASGRYVTIDELRLWRRERVAFVVQDAETEQNVTRAFP